MIYASLIAVSIGLVGAFLACTLFRVLEKRFKRNQGRSGAFGKPLKEVRNLQPFVWDQNDRKTP